MLIGTFLRLDVIQQKLDTVQVTHVCRMNQGCPATLVRFVQPRLLLQQQTLLCRGIR